VLDETYDEALRPMWAASNGRIVLLSTPHGNAASFIRRGKTNHVAQGKRSMLMNVRESRGVLG